MNSLHTMNEKKYFHKKIKNKGISILEIVIYFSLLAVLTVVVISSLISLFKSYNTIKVQQDMEISALQIIDKLQRDIYRADTIVQGQSSFSVPEGSLAVSIVDGTTDTYRYYVASSTFKVAKNGVFIGNLSQPNVIVNSFIVRQIVSTSSEAVKIELTLGVTPRYATSTIYKNFYTTVQLRN